jgi:phosphoribosylglycinamide formyltransferase 1
MKSIIILASGSGSNAENIIRYFNNSKHIQVTWLLSNNPEAYALKRAESLNVNTLVFDKKAFSGSHEVLNFLIKCQPDLIVLAGFLLLVPSDIVKAFPGRIINIHPALLPRHGGKGMYGDKVHMAVIENGDSETGITVHYVNEHYDEGNIIFQASCTVTSDDTPESVAAKVHQLEYEHFPKVIHDLLEKM